ncbi:MAG: hypothetical protein QW332_07660 [Thermoproteota archaeon]
MSYVVKYEKGILTHSKGRLLAYLVWFGKIRCDPSVPASVMRAIGYKSPGHWGADVEDLINEGYITIKQGCYKPTDKTRNLLEPLINLKKIALLNLIASGVIFLVGFAFSLSGQPLHSIWNILIGCYIAIANLIAIKPFYLIFKKSKRLILKIYF